MCWVQNRSKSQIVPLRQIVNFARAGAKSIQQWSNTRNICRLRAHRQFQDIKQSSSPRVQQRCPIHLRVCRGPGQDLCLAKQIASNGLGTKIRLEWPEQADGLEWSRQANSSDCDGWRASNPLIQSAGLAALGAEVLAMKDMFQKEWF